jgi:glycosyltransferase involved in cell wall biosynthesis
MSKPQVSIVIPVYNEQKYIRNCLRSIEEQTVKPLEVIVVDNNSTDNTVKIAQSFKFVRVINESRQGIIPARTAGCNAAKGDVIARLDADTILSKDWVERVAGHFARDDILVGLGGVAGLAELSPPGRFWFKWVLDHIRKSDIKRYETLHMYGHNMAFRRHAWDKIKKLLSDGSDSVLEDLDLSFALARVGKVETKRDVVVKVHALRSIDFNKYSRYAKEGLLTKKKYKDLGS